MYSAAHPHGHQHYKLHMEEDLYEALDEAEDYFIEVIDKQADEKAVPSRTEELHWAIEGLEGICMIRYKYAKMGHMATHGVHPYANKAVDTAQMIKRS